jgi:hypothetical protein
MDSGTEGVFKQQYGHFGAVDETTKRLVNRCQKVAWLADPDVESLEQVDSPVDQMSSASASPISPSKSQPPALPAPRKLTKRNSSKASTLTIGPYLTPHLEKARQSSLSMMEMAAQREKPGVITPSRNPSLKHNLRAAIMLGKREKPPPPKARRSGPHQSRGSIDLQEQSHPDMSATKADKDKAPLDGDRHVLPERNPTASPTQKDVGASETVPQLQVAPTINIVTGPPRKRPPPAPKARRWRGKGRKEEDTGGGGREPGKFDSNLPSLTIRSRDHSSLDMISPFSPIEKTFASPTSSALRPTDSSDIPSSVTAALGEVQAEAISNIGETLEMLHWTPSQPEMATSITFPVILEEQEGRMEELTQQRVVLAPPGLAPPRAVPGPRWALEKSPFLSDDDNEAGDGLGSSSDEDDLGGEQ